MTVRRSRGLRLAPALFAAALLAAALLAAAQLVAGGAALAQTSPLSPTQQRHKALAAMGRSCRPEAARFCPDTDPGQLRDVRICLMPFRHNLSLGCRSALKATRQSPVTQPLP